jgi:nucleotide-binding universal stress UspA family protein
VTFVTVTDPRTNLVPDPALVSSPADEYEAALITTAMAILTGARAEASKHGISCGAVHVRNDFPAEGILKEAESKGCDVIVMASHGRRGIARLVLGGEALRVLTNSAVPVLICR